MRLVLLTHPAALGSASMPRFAGMISSAMAQRGHAVEVWTSSQTFGRTFIPSAFVRKWLGYVDQFLLYPLELRRQIEQQPKDTLFVVADQALGMWVPRLAHRPHVIHCHDFLALKSALGELPGQQTGWTGRRYQDLIRLGFSRGQTFVSVSDKTRDDLHRFLPTNPKISEVVHNGLNHPFRPMEPAERIALLAKTGLELPESGILVHVGGNQWYKNRAGVLKIYRAYAAIDSQPAALWLIGSRPTPALVDLAAAIPKPGNVCFVSGLSNEQVNAAYSHAKALLFPSLDEGFGWPIAEAMAAGCPVITTNAAPMTEVAGQAARLIPRMPAQAGDQVAWAAGAAVIVNQIVHLDAGSRSLFVENGRQNALRFKSTSALDAYEQIYSRVLAQH
jgi:glycosyltransferase involved in cell wall biosynthesis